MNSTSQPAVEGRLLQMIYSPQGEYEGLLIESGGGPLQVVFDRHDADAGRVFAGIEAGQILKIDAVPQGPSPKGEGEHPVCAFGRLVAVDGKKPAKPRAAASGPAYRGKVVRLNYARHGAANGVVLDTGDFIHTKPEGMAKLKVKVGDAVLADGDAQRLGDDTGWAVEATKVNGKHLAPR